MCVKTCETLVLMCRVCFLKIIKSKVWNSWLRGRCVNAELCRLQSCAAYSDCCDVSKWRVLCSPGTTGEIRDWITAPIDYCSHHCPSERPGQEMHPPPCGLLGGTAPLYCLQLWWLAVYHCPYFVNGATITCPGCSFSWDYLISELFPGSQLWCCLFDVLSLRLLCWTVDLSSNVPRKMMLSVISLHSLNNKAGLQKTVPADVFACLYVNILADKLIMEL